MTTIYTVLDSQLSKIRFRNGRKAESLKVPVMVASETVLVMVASERFLVDTTYSRCGNQFSTEDEGNAMVTGKFLGCFFSRICKWADVKLPELMRVVL